VLPGGGVALGCCGVIVDRCGGLVDCGIACPAAAGGVCQSGGGDGVEAEELTDDGGWELAGHLE
jgi:hypothetical protein